MAGQGAATVIASQSPFAVTRRGYKKSPLSYLDPDYVREKAKDICRLFGSGSPQYEEFLNEINSDPLSQVTDLPKFTPGDIVNKKKKKKKSKNSKKILNSKLNHSSKSVQSIETINEEKSEINNEIYDKAEVTATVYEKYSNNDGSLGRDDSLKAPETEIGTITSTDYDESHNITYVTYDTKEDPILNKIREDALYQKVCNNLHNTIPAHHHLRSPMMPSHTHNKCINQVLQKTTSNVMTTCAINEYMRLTEIARDYKRVVEEKRKLELSLRDSQMKNATLRTSVQELRRTHSELHSEQSAMDEQVANQLQNLIREKAVLIEENCRLKNENEGLKALLEYATAEAVSEEDEDEDEDIFRNGEDDNLIMTCVNSEISAWHPPSNVMMMKTATTINTATTATTTESVTPLSSTSSANSSAVDKNHHLRNTIVIGVEDDEYCDSNNIHKHHDHH